MDLAIKDAQRHLGKFAASIVGVGLLIAIVLIMNGIFQGNTATACGSSITPTPIYE